MGLLAIILVGYLLLRSPGGSAAITSLLDGSGAGGVGLGEISFPPIGPNSDPRTWYQGTKPGTVTIGGQAAPSGWTPSATAKTTLGLAGAGIGAATGIAGSVAGIEGTTSVFAASTALGAATLGVGLAIGLASIVVGMISAHHQQALAAEGKALNDADPRMVNAMVLVLQGVLVGAITSEAQAQAALDQIVSDWYGEVKNIQRGTWHYTLSAVQDPSILGPDTTPGVENWFDAGIAGDKRPDPCNGACVVGHYFTERNRAIAMLAVRAALAGQHGVMTFPAIPAHETQSGFSEVMVTY